ncbi:MAG: hypothetical protein E7604_01670 [Ruminococcaceae bacterium]|nr:hypothetical protein [Oscillospiraceae bacterium]
MTELYFLDRSLSVTLGPIDDFISLVWSERYDTCGSFTLVLPMRQEVFAAALASAYLEVRARQCLGRIEKVTFTGGEGGGTMTVSGRMAESLLADRIISRGTVVSGPLCAAVEAVVAANAAEEAGERAIPCLVVRASEPFVGTDGLPLTVEDRVNGRQLDEWLYETLGSCGASYRIVPDHDAGVLVFSVYRGLDRTQAQEENSFAVFSASFSSAGEFDFLSDNTDCRNFAWIAGEGEGDARVMVTLDLRQDEREPRRELYVDARDLRSSDGEEQMSEETYRNLLLARGRQRLAQHAAVMRVSGSAAVYTEEDGTDAGAERVPAWGNALAPVGGVFSSSMICGVHYALGDLCDIVSDGLGMLWSERVTEVTYIYEGSRVRVEPRFGTAYPDLRMWIRSRVGDLVGVDR